MLRCLALDRQKFCNGQGKFKQETQHSTNGIASDLTPGDWFLLNSVVSLKLHRISFPFPGCRCTTQRLAFHLLKDNSSSLQLLTTAIKLLLAFPYKFVWT